MLHATEGFQLLLTGIASERGFTGRLSKEPGDGVLDVAGVLRLEEFVALIAHAPVVVTVNTATVHLASATGTRWLFCIR
jgi:ADP-heptose:LPS heptosyltransferase